MPATTLLKMATQAAIRFSAQINDLADMPYELARPILKTIQNPQQLRDIEINCPQIAEADEELWRAFIARDIPDWQKKMVEPKNKNSWYKVYRYLQRQEEKKAAEDEEKLRKTLAGEGLKKAENQALFVKKVLPHARAEDEHNFFIDGVRNTKLNSWGVEKKGAPSLKNAKTGSETLGALRRQAADASRARAMARPFVPQTAAQRLASAKQQIPKAPASMVSTPRPLTIAPRELHPHEKVMMKEIQKEKATRKIQPPARLSNAKFAEQNQQAVENATRQARAQNEAKLRALTQTQKKRPSATSPPSKPYDFASSPIITDAAKRSSPPAKAPSGVPASRTPAANSPAAASSPPAASAPSPPQQPVVCTKEPTAITQLSPSEKTVAPPPKSISLEVSSPPKMVKKRPETSIFMNAPKRRKA